MEVQKKILRIILIQAISYFILGLGIHSLFLYQHHTGQTFVSNMDDFISVMKFQYLFQAERFYIPLLIILGLLNLILVILARYRFATLRYSYLLLFIILLFWYIGFIRKAYLMLLTYFEFFSDEISIAYNTSIMLYVLYSILLFVGVFTPFFLVFKKWRRLNS